MGKKNFSFCKSRFRSLQLEEADANEINHDIHLANTLFQIKVRQKKYGCRLQSYITVHVSFKGYRLTLNVKKITLKVNIRSSDIYFSLGEVLILNVKIATILKKFDR